MKIYKSQFKALGGPAEIHLAVSSDELARQLVEQAIGELERFEAKYSRYREGSWISRLNKLAGTDQWLNVDSETEALLGDADKAFKESDGLIDITSGPLTSLWDFNSRLRPERQQIEERLNYVGWSKVECRERKIRLPIKGMQIDLGSIGKEFAADSLANFLIGKGVRSGMVNLAGDIAILGPPPDKPSWKVGIQHPRKKNLAIASINLANGGFATSGDYERFFEYDGERFTHIVNPYTGDPVNYWQSVSVCANTAVEAGRRATLTMLKGSDGMRYLERSGLRYFAIDHLGNQFHR